MRIQLIPRVVNCASSMPAKKPTVRAACERRLQSGNFRLDPESGSHTLCADVIDQRFEPSGKSRWIGLPVAHRPPPVLAELGVPADIHAEHLTAGSGSCIDQWHFASRRLVSIQHNDIVKDHRTTARIISRVEKNRSPITGQRSDRFFESAAYTTHGDRYCFISFTRTQIFPRL